MTILMSLALLTLATYISVARNGEDYICRGHSCAIFRKCENGKKLEHGMSCYMIRHARSYIYQTRILCEVEVEKVYNNYLLLCGAIFQLSQSEAGLSSSTSSITWPHILLLQIQHPPHKST